MNKRLRLVAVLLVLPLTAVVAQEAPPPLEPGTRVRVTAPDIDKYDGTLQAMRGDTLTVDTLRIAVESVTRLDVYRGQKSRVGKGALWGGVVGAVVGGVLGGIAMGICSGSSTEECGLFIPLGALGGGALGAGIGAGIGAIAGPSDRWADVPLDQIRVSLVPRRDGFALGFAVAF